MKRIDQLVRAYESHADPVRAGQMTRYMRNQFAFAGIPTPERRRLDRAVVAGWPQPSEKDLAGIALDCWRRPEREYQYFACDYLVGNVKRASAGLLGTVAQLITVKSWWDTVDMLAARVVGPLVQRYQELTPVMDRWIEDDNLWLARAALLHQLHYGRATDADRLFRYAVLRAGDRDFFIRKAIGWALRQYSKTDGPAVSSFVELHVAQLAPLSRREALAWLERGAAHA